MFVIFAYYFVLEMFVMMGSTSDVRFLCLILSFPFIVFYY